MLVSHLLAFHQKVFLMILMLFTFSASQKQCFGEFCLEDGYEKASPPSERVSVKISLVLSEIFGVNDNDFSLSFAIMVKLVWVDNRIQVKERLKNTTERLG